jgi:hypothetical protein
VEKCFDVRQLEIFMFICIFSYHHTVILGCEYKIADTRKIVYFFSMFCNLLCNRIFIMTPVLISGENMFYEFNRYGWFSDKNPYWEFSLGEKIVGCFCSKFLILFTIKLMKLYHKIIWCLIREPPVWASIAMIWLNLFATRSS